jgi:hypothetical protein
MAAVRPSLSISNVTMLSIDRGQRRVAQIQGILPFVPWLTVVIDCCRYVQK